MGYILAPRPARNRPPQGTVRINWNHELSRGLVFLLSGHDNGADLVSGTTPTLSSVTRDVSVDSRAWSQSGTGSMNYGTLAATALAGAMTIFGRARVATLNLGRFASQSDADADKGWNCGTGNSGVYFKAPYGSGDLQGESNNATVPTNREFQFVITWDGTATASTSLNFWVDGTKGTITNNTDGVGTHSGATAENMYVGLTNIDGSSNTGLIMELGVWTGVLDTVQIYELFENSRTMLEPVRNVVFSFPGKVSSTASTGNISPADSFAATSNALKQGAGAVSPADSFAATSAALKAGAGAVSPADSFAATSKALKAAAGAISPGDSFDATTKALKASTGAVSPGDSFAATTQALKASAGAVSPADSFDATTKALKQSAGVISPADSFGASSTKLAASAGSFSPTDAIEATSAALKAAAGSFSPGDNFAATANTSGSQGDASPGDSFSATGASRAAGAGSWLPGDAFTATFLELGAGAGNFSPAEAFTATGAALFAAAGAISPVDSFAGTSKKLAAAVGACSPADSFGATGASLFKFTGNISPPDEFSGSSPSVGGASSSMFLTTTAR